MHHNVKDASTSCVWPTQYNSPGRASQIVKVTVQGRVGQECSSCLVRSLQQWRRVGCYTTPVERLVSTVKSLAHVNTMTMNNNDQLTI